MRYRYNEFVKGYMEAAEDLADWLNSLDTEHMTVRDLRSAVYTWALSARPKLKSERE